MTEGMLRGDVLSLSRLITMVENDLVSTADVLARIYPFLSGAYHVGITGPPGAGKSTLTTGLATGLRAGGATVGIVACDPSSPFSGGALLGDRIRMDSLSLDEGVFVRSMATRGALGGLSRKAHAVARLLEASGKDYILLETVGVGQTEMDVRDVVDTTVLVFTPIVGDYIQAMKAGIIEIADVFVINKMDLGNAAAIEENLASVLAMRVKRGEWRPPIIRAQATEGVGVKDVREAIDAHRSFLRETGVGARRRSESRKREFEEHVRERLLDLITASVVRNPRYLSTQSMVGDCGADPYRACEEVLADEELWDDVLALARNGGLGGNPHAE